MTKPVSVQQLNTLISKITFLNKNKMNRITTSKSIVYSVILWSSIVTVYGQVSQKIGGNAGTIDPKAVLELESTTKGFLLPRMTAVQVAAITNPTSGMMVFWQWKPTEKNQRLHKSKVNTVDSLNEISA